MTGRISRRARPAFHVSHGLPRGRVYTCRVHSPVLAPLSVAAAILAILCALSLGVIPNLSREGGPSRPLHAWLDVWLPLLLTLPLAGAALLGRQAGLPSAFILWVLATGSISTTAFFCGLALLDRRLATGLPVIETVHVLTLFAVGIVLLGAAYVARLPDWTGHLFLTAGILWLWSVSSDPGDSRQSGASGGALFLVDWSGPLASPVLLRWKVLVAVGLTVGAAGIASHQLQSLWSVVETERVSPTLTLLVNVLAFAGQAVALAALWRLAGPGAVVRSSVSTGVLSTLAVIGVMCISLVPWRAIITRGGVGGDATWHVRDLVGLSILAPAGLTVLALTLVGLAHRLEHRARVAPAWLLMGLALTGAASGAVLARWSW